VNIVLWTEERRRKRVRARDIYLSTPWETIPMWDVTRHPQQYCREMGREREELSPELAKKSTEGWSLRHPTHGILNITSLSLSTLS
jgi:hypothetical protein